MVISVFKLSAQTFWQVSEFVELSTVCLLWFLLEKLTSFFENNSSELHVFESAPSEPGKLFLHFHATIIILRSKVASEKLNESLMA